MLAGGWVEANPGGVTYSPACQLALSTFPFSVCIFECRSKFLRLWLVIWGSLVPAFHLNYLPPTDNSTALFSFTCGM